jgi:xylulokinase
VSRFFIACDLGTGGNKAVMYDQDGISVADFGVSYPTFHPKAQYHEQRPTDWWNAVVASVRGLLESARIDTLQVKAIGMSGHSLGCVPIDDRGNLLLESVPIWSDSRATSEADEFFQQISRDDWYLNTGNGFPPALYTVFKVMWLRKHYPEVYGQTRKVLGTKDYVNFRLTGRVATDHSYASGTGIYDLAAWNYNPDLLRSSRLEPSYFPEILPSTEILGELTSKAAHLLGLPRSVTVVAGGVDNSCMALGAGNIKEGDIYGSLGSSSWIAVSSNKPVLDLAVRPFVFTHVIPGMFNSATSIFSAGTSLDWVRDQLCRNLSSDQSSPQTHYERMFELAASVSTGAHRLLFVPTLAGGTHFEGGPSVRGAFVGLDLSHTQADIIRAVLEGIAFGLRAAFDELRRLTAVRDEMLLFGGGAKSPLWRQIFADVYNCTVVKSKIDQETAALGAAALAAVGTGSWADFSRVVELHEIEDRSRPNAQNVAVYESLLPVYRQAAEFQRELGDMLAVSGCRALNQ